METPRRMRVGRGPSGGSELADRWNSAEGILLRNLKVVDPEGERRGICDMWIRQGMLEAMAPSLPDSGGLSVDLDGATVMPGLFDMHVHLREPGAEEAETIATGSLAAARGGFTGVACMPNTPVRIDTRAVIDLVLARAAEACGTRVYPVAAMTRNLEGKELTEMAELAEAGAVAVSDDGRPVSDSEVCRRAMEYARMCDLPVLAHSEELSLRGQGVMHEGYWSTALGLRGIPAACEEIGVARDIALAELTGSSLHLCHLSTRGGVALLRQAKEKGLKVTAETAPHYLTLTDESLRTYDSSFKMNPPLRTGADMAALRLAVKSGLIDAIATDHAPHPPEAKEGELDRAPFGVIGLESSFGVTYRAMVEEEGMKLEDLITRMAVAPRRILGLPGGRLVLGQPADFTVIDLGWEWTVEAARFASLGRNCPYEGWTLRGKVLFTMAAGKVTHAAVAPSERRPSAEEPRAATGSRVKGR
jgi:dihydroorotase